MNLAYEMRSVVRFADCDAAGIHFFPRYLERVNQCVEEWFAGPLRASFKTLHLDQRVGVPTARLSVEFKAPSRLEDALSYRLHVVKVGRSSANLRLRVVCGEELRLEVRQTLVFVDLETMKARPWPDDLRQRMAAFVSDAPEETPA